MPCLALHDLWVAIPRLRCLKAGISLKLLTVCSKVIKIYNYLIEPSSFHADPCVSDRDNVLDLPAFL